MHFVLLFSIEDAYAINAGELKIPNTNIIEININRVRLLNNIGYIQIVLILDENTCPIILSIDKSLLEFTCLQFFHVVVAKFSINIQE